MICHRICNTGATSGADITYSSGEPGASLGFLWGSCCSTFSSVYGHNVTSNKTNIRSLHQIVGLELSEYDEEKFVDTKGVTWSRNSRDRQHNGKMKKDHMTNNDIPNTTLKTKYWTTQTVICILYSFYIILIRQDIAEILQQLTLPTNHSIKQRYHLIASNQSD